MPMLLEDLAEETSESIRRIADRMDEEAKRFYDRRASEPPDDLRQALVALARWSSRDAISRVPQAEAIWQSSLDVIRTGPPGDDAIGILSSLSAGFDSYQRLCVTARDFWALAESLGAVAEPTAELDQAQRRFAELAADARKALEHRERGWRPADPDRLAAGLRLAREGKTVAADQARTWFHRR